MTEVTRVPLQPIAKGSLAKFWLGVLVGLLIAGIIAFVTTYEKGVSVDTVTAGTGANPTEDSVVFIDYVGKLADGTEFDRSPPPQPLPPALQNIIPDGFPMELAGVVPGFREGMLQTQEGGVYTIEIPAAQAYGSTPPPGSPIPADADLTFDVTVHDIMSQEEFQQLVQQAQMMMMQAQGEAGADEGGEGAAPVDPSAPQ